MGETQQNLEIGIGDKEPKGLKPKNVTVVNVEIKSVGTKGAKIVNCSSKHPDREELIDISSVKFEGKTKFRECGLFLNLEKKDNESDPDKIQKGSPLAILLNFVNAKTIAELKNKELITVEDENGFLCFKAY